MAHTAASSSWHGHMSRHLPSTQRRSNLIYDGLFLTGSKAILDWYLISSFCSTNKAGEELGLGPHCDRDSRRATVCGGDLIGGESRTHVVPWANLLDALESR
mmetsp:Transcript_6571/g.13846  ORF Transcript_6571/g.13846 Transcript_6571/m.13846 type:complete len:102 (+) Transcript_6571:795-1100(+)